MHANSVHVVNNANKIKAREQRNAKKKTLYQKKEEQIVDSSKIYCTFAVANRELLPIGYPGRVVRHRSAKPSTAVRICWVPLSVRLFRKIEAALFNIKKKGLKGFSSYLEMYRPHPCSDRIHPYSS